MQAVIDMAKAHLQNVSAKIQELESQKAMIDSEISKLKNYLNDGVNSVQIAESQEK